MSCSRLLQCISCFHAVRQKYQDGWRKIRWNRFSLYFAIRVVLDEIGSLLSHVHGWYLLMNMFVNDNFTPVHFRYYLSSLMFVVYFFSEHVRLRYFLLRSWKISTLVFTWNIIFHFQLWYNLSCSMKIYFLLSCWLAAGQWFSLGTLVSSASKTDHIIVRNCSHIL